MNQATATKQAPMTKPVKPPKKRKAKSLDKAKARSGWFFVAPFVLIFFLIYIPVLVDSITYSFHHIINLPTIGGGFVLDYVGWDNYERALFSDPNFVTLLTGGVKQLLLEVPAIVVFSLFMAVLLNQKMVGRTLFRAIFFIPVILSTGLIDDIDASNAFTQYSSGGAVSGGGGAEDEAAGEAAVAAGEAVQQSGGGGLISAVDLQGLFSSMKVGTELVDYVVGIVNDIYDLVNRSGVQMLIFLAGLQSISPAIYESCSIDGASGWETFWKITIPMVSPMILVNTVYTIIDAFTANSNTVMNYIKQVYNQPDGTTVSSAMAWLYFLIVMVIIAAATGLISGFVFYQKRDA